MHATVDPAHVAEIVGYGEVGSLGSARTRWAAERCTRMGDLRVEAQIELAAVMGLIDFEPRRRHANGKVDAGWVDAATREALFDHQVVARFSDYIKLHTGIRLIEPELVDGYDPNRKLTLFEVLVEKDMEPVAVSRDHALSIAAAHGVHAHCYEDEQQQWHAVLRAGARILVPRVHEFSRVVAGLVPTGWTAARHGITLHSLDPTTVYTLVAAADAFATAGIADPYELHRYVHASEIAVTLGSGVGGQLANRRLFFGRLFERPNIPADTLQETFANTMAAWLNMLMVGSCGPIMSTVGACGTGLQSVAAAVALINTGRAKIAIAGGVDDFQEERGFKFAQMRATIDSTIDLNNAMRTPRETSRPTTSSRAGFVESQGAGVQVLMRGDVALAMGVPIYAIIARIDTALDKQSNSLPAPGQGLLSCTRAARQYEDSMMSAGADSSPKQSSSSSTLPSHERPLVRSRLLGTKYRAQQANLARDALRDWARLETANVAASHPNMPTLLDEIQIELQARLASVSTLWSTDYYRDHIRISPIEGALATFGLTIDDIHVASFHGTSTKQNDLNESDVVSKQLAHMQRRKSDLIPAIFQKNPTGHPKGAAASWMINGLLQVIASNLVLGNANGDNVDSALEVHHSIAYPARPIQLTHIHAALVTSFGFGQVGAEALLVHPRFLMAALPKQQYDQYAASREMRIAAADAILSQRLTAGLVSTAPGVASPTRPYVQVKTHPVCPAALQAEAYLNPLSRASIENDGSYTVHPADARNDRSRLQIDALNALSALTQQVNNSKRASSEETNSSAKKAIHNATGIDIQLVSDVNIDNETFLKRNFSPIEIEQCKSRPAPRESFAGRWAAKEAVIKAISHHIGHDAWACLFITCLPCTLFFGTYFQTIPSFNRTPLYLFLL